jgi:type I restriction enzyme S subunit
MSRYKAYPEYRESGVQWLDDLPKHWNVKRTKQMFSLTRELVGKNSNEYQLLSLTLRGVIHRDISDGSGKIPAEFDTYQVVRPDNLIFCLFDIEETPRTIGLSADHGMITGAYNVYTCLDECIPKYAYYYFMHIDSFKGLQPFYTGLRKVVRAETFSNIEIPAPSINEQWQISNFLDHETAKIDALIEKQQRLIELLKEKRQAVISHAVTKGLNPNAPMKDSGVEWLGEVPAHWDVHAIKHIVSTPITDGPHETPEFFDTGIPFVSAEAVSSGRIDFEKIRAHISDSDNQRFSKKYSPKKFDIYMVKSGATTGVTAIVETDDVFNIWSPLAAIRCNELNYPYFVLNFMRSRNFADAIAISWSFGTQQNIGMKVIENLPITRPPLSEAIEIAQFLEEKSAKFDKIILQAQAQIELMQERRTALISAAVTGKIDVRDWQAAA